MDKDSMLRADEGDGYASPSESDSSSSAAHTEWTSDTETAPPVSEHDLTSEQLLAPSVRLPQPSWGERHKATTQARLALFFTGLLGLMFFMAMLGFFAGWGSVADIKAIIEPFLTPLVALLGAALAFYFAR